MWHLRAFGANRAATEEYDPAQQVQVGKKGLESITLEARRIGGCMNHACFLPPDNTQAPSRQQGARATLPHPGRCV